MKRKTVKYLFLPVLGLIFCLIDISFAAASETPRNISYSYRKQDFSPENFKIEIEKEDTVAITGFVNLNRVAVVDPRFAAATIVSPGELSVRGEEAGETFIHIWDGEGLTTIKLLVRYRGFKDIQKEIKKQKEKRKGRPIKFGYNYDDFKTRLDYKKVSREIKTYDRTHSFYASGDTPYGYYDSDLQYAFRKTPLKKTDDVKSWDMSLINDFFALSLGDLTDRFTDLTFPRTHYQGIQLESGTGKSPVRFSLLAGSTGYHLWGARLFSNAQPENRFYGFYSEITPEEDLMVFASFMNADKATEKMNDVARTLSSAGVKYKVDKHLELAAESAITNKERTAFSTSASFNIDKLYLDAIYRDITVNYKTVVGNAPYLGKRGVFTSARFTPLPYVSLASTFDVYQNRLTPDPDSVDKGNKEFTFDMQLNAPVTNTNFLMSYYHRDTRGQDLPVITFGQSYVLYQLLDLYKILNIRGQVGYSNTHYKSFLTGESNYKDDTIRGSISVRPTIKPLRGLSFFVEEMLDFRNWNIRDTQTSPRRFLASAGYNSQVWNLPLYIDISASYQVDSHVNSDAIGSIVGEDKFTGDLSLRYYIDKYVYLYLNGHAEDIKGSSDPTLTRTYTSINAGIKYNWDSDVVLPEHGTVNGYAFRDINKNSVMDEGDLPLKGVNIMVDGKRKARTNTKGFYRIKYLTKGERLVSLDLKDIPKDLVSTTPLNVEVDLRGMDVERVDFGVTSKSIIEGMVFNDVNRNGILDEEDAPLGNILIQVDDGRSDFSSPEGFFMVRNVLTGERTVTVDKNTVPVYLIQEEPFKHTVELKEGDTKKVVFMFYAPRFISGKVYVDSNKNNVYEKGEGVEGVKLTCGDKVSVTDKDGSFLFRDLPGGENIIIIDESTLPEGLRPENSRIPLDMRKENDERRDFNIKLLSGS